MMIERITRGLRLAAVIPYGLRAGLRRAPIPLIDIGARGGLAQPWQMLYRAGFVRPVFFEPEPKAAAALAAQYPGARIEPRAAWNIDGTQTLHITEMPGGSSLLEPHFPIVKRIPVETVRADQCSSLADLDCMVVKADVQGGELAVLQGFGDFLSRVCCSELEVSFAPGYRDQPMIESVVQFMHDAGFGLFDLRTFGVLNMRHAVQANAYFCRRSITSQRQRTIKRIFRLTSGVPVRP